MTRFCIKRRFGEAVLGRAFGRKQIKAERGTGMRIEDKDSSE